MPGRSMRAASSGELDLGGPLVLAAVRIQEGDLEHARLHRLEREGEERVLADGLGRVGLEDLPAVVRHDHLVDEVVVPVHRLSGLVPLDDLHGMNHEAAYPHHVPPLDARGGPGPDLPDLCPGLASAPPDRYFD